jgi:hypothetical protein
MNGGVDLAREQGAVDRLGERALAAERRQVARPLVGLGLDARNRDLQPPAPRS